jgi:hypothetical protein
VVIILAFRDGILGVANRLSRSLGERRQRTGRPAEPAVEKERETVA